MYTPAAFRMEELPDLHAAMRAAGLATFVTGTGAGLMATPLPLFLAPDEGPLGTLYGHLARANPQRAEPPTCEALAIFGGADAYVTPAWYATKRETGRVVPTWNYVAVHAYGTPDFFEDATRLHAVVSRLTDLHEAARPDPWAVTDAPDPYIRSQLKGIVGLRLPIARIEGKRKMSQNRSAEDRAGVAAGLGEATAPATGRRQDWCRWTSSLGANPASAPFTFRQGLHRAPVAGVCDLARTAVPDRAPERRGAACLRRPRRSPAPRAPRRPRVGGWGRQGSARPRRAPPRDRRA